jgi:hypothetical protein
MSLHISSKLAINLTAVTTAAIIVVITGTITAHKLEDRKDRQL